MVHDVVQASLTSLSRLASLCSDPGQSGGEEAGEGGALRHADIHHQADEGERLQPGFRRLSGSVLPEEAWPVGAGLVCVL